MSDLTALLNLDVKDKGPADRWGFNNFDDHQLVRDAIQKQTLENLVVYELYPVNWQNWESYALRHQSAHDEANGALGLAGTDLTSVDFNDEKKAADWIFAHYREHVAWHETLGI
jgi:hypothetical protein